MTPRAEAIRRIERDESLEGRLRAIEEMQLQIAVTLETLASQVEALNPSTPAKAPKAVK